MSPLTIRRGRLLSAAALFISAATATCAVLAAACNGNGDSPVEAGAGDADVRGFDATTDTGGDDAIARADAPHDALSSDVLSSDAPSSDMDAGPSDGGDGGAIEACAPPAYYPPPPYGYRVGRVIENLAAPGKRDENHDGVIDSTDPDATIALSDFFHDPAILAVAVIRYAEWCAPSTLEASKDATLAQNNKSVGFLGVIGEGPQAGVAATMTQLVSWAKKYHLAFPLMLDPKNDFAPYIDIPIVTTKMVIRTSDMRIVWESADADDAAFQAALDAVVADAGAPPFQPDAGCAAIAPPVYTGNRTFCDDCASDSDCPPPQRCATDTGGGRYCARPCAVADDCHPAAGACNDGQCTTITTHGAFEICGADPGGKGNVCRPVGGTCHAGGKACDPCRPDVASDCAAGSADGGEAGLTCFEVTQTRERFCTLPCTASTDANGVVGGDTCPSGMYCAQGQPPVPSQSFSGMCARDPAHTALTCFP